MGQLKRNVVPFLFWGTWWTGHCCRMKSCAQMAQFFPTQNTGKRESSCFPTMYTCSIKRNRINIRRMDVNKMRSWESMAVLYRSRTGESMWRVKMSRSKSKYWSSKEVRRDQHTGRRETRSDRRTRQLGVEKGEQREEREMAHLVIWWMA